LSKSQPTLSRYDRLSDWKRVMITSYFVHQPDSQEIIVYYFVYFNLKRIIKYDTPWSFVENT